MATAEQTKAVQDAYFAVNRTTLNASVAGAVADQIALGNTTLDAYIATQIASTASTTGAAVAIASFITGVTPTSDKLTALKVEADKQVASYTALKVGNPALGAFEAFGKGFAADASTGFAAKYGALSTADFINTVYTQVYATTPSAGAFANLSSQITYFTNLYISAGISATDAALQAKGAVLGQIVGYAFISDAAASATIDNQVSSFLTSIAKGDATGYGAALPTGAGSGNVGLTISLSANADGPNAIEPAVNTLGTAGNDTYVGSSGTLQSFDVINGGGGVDTVTLRDVSAGGVDITPGLSNVEVVNVTALAGGATTFNLATSSGVTTLISSAGNQGVTFSNAAALASVQINGTTAGAFTLGYAPSVVAGTTDVQNVTLSSAVAGAIQIGAQGSAAGIETLNVTATGTNTATGLATGAKTVAFAGTGSVAVQNAATGALATLTNATSINASTNSGGVSFAIDGTKDVAVVGSSGNDFIGINGLTSADSVDGGAGTDWVVYTDGTGLPGSKVSNLLNFEGVRVEAVAAGTVGINVDNFSGSTIANFQIGTGFNDTDGVTTGTVNITNGTTGSTITQFDDANVDGTVTFALKTDGSADVLNYKLVNTNTGGAGTHGLGTLTANTIETLNIDASQQVKLGTTFTTETLSIATLNGTAATTLKITGDSAVSLGTTASSLTALTSIDASTATKAVTLGGVGQAFSTSITGATVVTGSGNDTVSLSVGTTGVLKAVDLGSQTTTGTGDTLILSGGGALTGVTVVDLTSSTDQVQQLLGSANAAAQINIESIDLSGLNGSAQITGTAGANTIVGTAGADTISAGAGNDIVTGGLGIDTIDLGAGSDTIVFASAFAAGNANHDDITNFQFGTASADAYDIGFSVLNGTTGPTAALVALAPVAVGDNGTATANDVIFTFSGANDKLAAGTNATNAVANAVTALTSGTDFSSVNIATGDSLVLVLDNGTDSFVFHYVADGTANTTAATDLELIGIVRGQLASQVAIGDFI